MIVAIDVDYRDGGDAVAAAAVISHWAAHVVDRTVITRIGLVKPYQPGRFYERELPCVLAVLSDLGEAPAAIVVDGYVTLGPERRDGLGAHLYRELGCTIPVIGVAKNRFKDTPPETEVLRGTSLKPLYVTALGITGSEARTLVRSMDGAHRIPTVLAAVDRACRSAQP